MMCVLHAYSDDYSYKQIFPSGPLPFSHRAAHVRAPLHGPTLTDSPSPPLLRPHAPLPILPRAHTLLLDVPSP